MVYIPHDMCACAHVGVYVLLSLLLCACVCVRAKKPFKMYFNALSKAMLNTMLNHLVGVKKKTLTHTHTHKYEKAVKRKVKEIQ